MRTIPVTLYLPVYDTIEEAQAAIPAGATIWTWACHDSVSNELEPLIHNVDALAWVEIPLPEPGTVIEMPDDADINLEGDK